MSFLFKGAEVVGDAKIPEKKVIIVILSIRTLAMTVKGI